MKPVENKHAERILSLLVILYGLWLVIPNVDMVIAALTWGGYIFIFFYFEVHSQSYALSYALPRIAIGCWLLFFFPYVVRWVGYFATHEKVRSKRCWSPFEILAVPLILFIFAELLLVFFVCSDTLAMLVSPDDLIAGFVHFHYSGWSGFIVGFFALLLYLAIAVVCLLCVRPITAWLLHKAD